MYDAGAHSDGIRRRTSALPELTIQRARDDGRATERSALSGHLLLDLRRCVRHTLFKLAQSAALPLATPLFVLFVGELEDRAEERGRSLCQRRRARKPTQSYRVIRAARA